MKKYQLVIVPGSSYRGRVDPGVYLGTRPYDKRHIVLMRNKDDPTTFVIRVLESDEYKRLHDTGINMTKQITAIMEMFDFIEEELK